MTYAAIMSLSEKTLDAVNVASYLQSQDIVILASSGTYKFLLSQGVSCLAIDEYCERENGSPSKTLQPKLFDGIFLSGSCGEGLEFLEEQSIFSIKYVISDIYHFSQLYSNGKLQSMEEAINHIDVGGPALVSAAARHWENIYCFTDINDFSAFQCLKREKEFDSRTYRLQLAKKAYASLNKYYASINQYFLNYDIRESNTTEQQLLNLKVFDKFDQLKCVERANYLADGSRHENVAEHSWQAALMSMLLCDQSNQEIDLLKVIQMLLVHDLPEIIQGDVSVFVEKNQRLHYSSCLGELLKDAPKNIAIQVECLITEFEENITAEANFANAIDKFMPLYIGSIAPYKAWGDFTCSREEYINKKSSIKSGSMSLWRVALSIIDQKTEENTLTRS